MSLDKDVSGAQLALAGNCSVRSPALPREPNVALGPVAWKCGAVARALPASCQPSCRSTVYSVEQAPRDARYSVTAPGRFLKQVVIALSSNMVLASVLKSRGLSG